MASARYPATRRTDDTDTLFGIRVADPYRWLENGKDPEVVAWLKAQDTFAREQLARINERAAIKQRLEQLFYYDALYAPQRRGKTLFYSRRHAR